MRAGGCLAVLLALAGCQTTVQKFPENLEAFTQPVVVSGKFIHGRYLEQFPECDINEPDENGEYVICLDPPLLALKLKIEEVVYGRLDSPIIEVMTTDHNGLLFYRDRADEDYLVNLLSDGTSFIMPRYDRHHLYRDTNDSLVAEVWDEDLIWWLQCLPSTMKEEFAISDLSNTAGEPIDDTNELWLKEHKGMYVVKDNNFYPKYGIRTSKLKEVLMAFKPDQYLAQCTPDE